MKGHRERTGSIVQQIDDQEIKPTLFGAALPGAGEVAALDLPQAVAESGEEIDPRNLALLVRPERYQERVTRQQEALAEREQRLNQQATEAR